MRVETTMDLAIMVRGRRGGLKIGQADVARAAGVGRQWIIKFEGAEETVELGKVMRTLETLGIELTLRFADPPPAWTVPLTAAAGTRAHPYGRYRHTRRELRFSDAANPPKKT